MSTQENPVASLLEDLGIGTEEPTQEIDGDSKEDLNLSDSTDDSTQMDEVTSETDSDTDTSNNDDTSKQSELEAKLEELIKKQETYEKRLSDKDKYINELKNGKKEDEAGVEDNSTEDSEETFWDNPEGYITKIQSEIQAAKEETRIANLRLDESFYARDKQDYYNVVNQENMVKAFEQDSTFRDEFQSSDKPYEVAYKYLKQNQEQSKASEESMREKIRQEERQKIMEEMKKGSNKETVPSMNKLGSSSSSNDTEVDGFAAVFGSGY
jgi:hypothetical protein